MDGDLNPLCEVKKLGKLGIFEIRTMAASRSADKLQSGDALPYSVGVYRFASGGGLYLLAGFSGTNIRLELENLLDSLSYTGLGGKRSAGLGRFSVASEPLSGPLSQRLKGSGVPVMTLSSRWRTIGNWSMALWMGLNICCKNGPALLLLRNMRLSRAGSVIFMLSVQAPAFKPVFPAACSM